MGNSKYLMFWFLPIYQAGNNLEQITDLDERGGRNTMRRLISPDSNWRSFSDITSICLPILKSETSVGAICLTKVRKSSLDSCMTLMSNKLFSNSRVFASWLVSIDSIVSMILYPYSILLYVIIFIYKRKTKKNKYTKYLVLLFIYIIYNYTYSPLKCQVFF